MEFEVKVAPCNKVIASLLTLLLLLTSCSGAAVATPRPILITIGGATALQPVLQALTAEYTSSHPNVLFTLRGGGSTLGEEMALSRRVDLGASTLLPPSEPTSAQRLLVRTPVGVDGLAIVVHSSSSVEGLTSDQLRRLYSGEILDWAEVGGAPGEVVLVSREDGSGSRTLFEDEIMQDEPVSLTAVVMPTSQDMVDYIAKTPNTIGYVSRGLVMAQAGGETPVTPTPPGLVAEVTPVTTTEVITVTRTPTPVPALRVRVLPIDGVSPTLNALRDRSYPLVQPMYFLSRGQTIGGVRQFVDFVLSPAGQAIVRRYHLPVR